MYVDITINRRGKYTVLYLPIVYLRRWLLLLAPVIIRKNSAL